MDAEEARRITRRNLEGPIVEPFLKIAYARIAEAAGKGKSAVSHPFYGDVPREEVRKMALRRLEELGYKIERRPNPDPGDPRSSAYDVVRW